MKTIGMFDVIGPNMVGPSSSHTAGAVRIALLARRMCEGKITKVEFMLYGSFAGTYKGHGTDRALLAGILGFDTEDGRIRESFRHAEEAGLAYSFSTNTTDRDAHPNTVEITLHNEEGRVTKVTGVSLGGGAAEIRELNGVEIGLSGEYPTILIRQRDKPGILAHITQCLTASRINIAFMKLYRENKGRTAYTIVECDDIVQPKVVEAIKIHPDIENAILIQ